MLGARAFRCLVTGGAGFIGSHVAERLVALGHQVRVVDNLSTGDEANLAGLDGEIEFLRGDLCEAQVCRSAVARIDVVFHLAALPSVPRSLKDPWASHDANVNATMRLLEACRAAQVKRVVYSSSSSVYGDTPVLPKTESAEPLPRSPYAASKLAGEQYVLAFARAGLIDLIELVGKITGRELAYQRLPAREGDVRDSLAGLRRAERLLGYQPLVSLAEGLRRTWIWFARQPVAAVLQPAAMPAGGGSWLIRSSRSVR